MLVFDQMWPFLIRIFRRPGFRGVRPISHRLLPALLPEIDYRGLGVVLPGSPPHVSAFANAQMRCHGASVAQWASPDRRMGNCRFPLPNPPFKGAVTNGEVGSNRAVRPSSWTLHGKIGWFAEFPPRAVRTAGSRPWLSFGGASPSLDCRRSLKCGCNRSDVCCARKAVALR